MSVGLCWRLSIRKLCVNNSRTETIDGPYIPTDSVREKKSFGWQTHSPVYIFLFSLCHTIIDDLSTRDYRSLLVETYPTLLMILSLQTKIRIVYSTLKDPPKSYPTHLPVTTTHLPVRTYIPQDFVVSYESVESQQLDIHPTPILHHTSPSIWSSMYIFFICTRYTFFMKKIVHGQEPSVV